MTHSRMLQCNTSGIYQWTPSITDHVAVATLVTRIVSIMPVITSHLLPAQGGQSYLVPSLVPGQDLGLTKAPHLPRPELTWPVLAAAWPSIAPSLLSWSQQPASSQQPAAQHSRDQIQFPPLCKMLGLVKTGSGSGLGHVPPCGRGLALAVKSGDFATFFQIYTA